MAITLAFDVYGGRLGEDLRDAVIYLSIDTFSSYGIFRLCHA